MDGWMDGVRVHVQKLFCSPVVSPAGASSHLSFPSRLASFVYETEHFNGVAELLEILGR